MSAAATMSQPIAHFSREQKRPKLSLQTSSLSINYGSSSKGLSTIATSSAATTPTALNTLNNAYDLTSHRPSPASATRISRSQSPKPSRRSDRSHGNSLPYGIKPILKNSTTYPNSISASPCTNSRKVLFPQAKRVGFRKDLEEEIVTQVYVARHSDLVAEPEDKDDNLSISAQEETTEAVTESDMDADFVMVLSSQSRTTNDGRRSIVISSSEVANKSETAATPCISKKRRNWEWTLGPIAPQEKRPNRDEEDTDPGLGTEGEDEPGWILVSATNAVSKSQNREMRPLKRQRSIGPTSDLSSTDQSSIDTNEAPS